MKSVSPFYFFLLPPGCPPKSTTITSSLHSFQEVQCLSLCGWAIIYFTDHLLIATYIGPRYQISFKLYNIVFLVILFIFILLSALSKFQFDPKSPLPGSIPCLNPCQLISLQDFTPLNHKYLGCVNQTIYNHRTSRLEENSDNNLAKSIKAGICTTITQTHVLQSLPLLVIRDFYFILLAFLGIDFVSLIHFLGQGPGFQLKNTY